MINLGIIAMATRRRLTAFTFGLYPVKFESSFIPSVSVDTEMLPAAIFNGDSFSSAVTIGGSLDVVIAYSRTDTNSVDTFAVAAVTIGGSLDVVIAYSRADTGPADTFAVAAVTLGGALDVVISYARTDLDTDTFQAAAVTVGGALETI